MELTPGTKVLDLVKTHGFLLEFLAEYAPEFEKLKNPILQKTMGRFATMQMAASMAGVPLEKLLADVARVISDQTGEEVVVEGEAGPLLDPELAALVVTAVAPHNLFARPLVFGPETRLQLTAEGDRPARVNLDGRFIGDLEPGESVTITRGPVTSLQLRPFASLSPGPHRGWRR